MKTALIIIIAILGIVIIYLLFFKPSDRTVITNEAEVKRLMTEITVLNVKNDSLDKVIVIKDSIINRYEQDTIDMAKKHKQNLAEIDKLTEQQIKDKANEYIDSTLNAKEKEKEIAKLGTKLDNCEEARKRDGVQITRMKSIISDYKEKDKNNKIKEKDYKLAISKLQEDIDILIDNHKKETRKLKMGGIFLIALGFGLAIFT